jgi:hypothetical protein
MSACNHADTYLLPKPWPTGDTIEVCNCCGMSRAHWEQGSSPWIQVDLPRRRREIQDTVDRLIKDVRVVVRSCPTAIQ